MTDDDASVLAALQAEFADGVEFLDAKGYAGARVQTSDLPQFETMIVELAVASPIGAGDHCWVEIEPCRVGWRLQASLAVRGGEAPEVDLGWHRVIARGDAESAARVLARRAYVALWEHLSGVHRT
ncbi:MAG: hypothetical protein AB1627_15995 [Chloroflexota bacterium]